MRKFEIPTFAYQGSNCNAQIPLDVTFGIPNGLYKRKTFNPPVVNFFSTFGDNFDNVVINTLDALFLYERPSRVVYFTDDKKVAMLNTFIKRYSVNQPQHSIQRVHYSNGSIDRNVFVQSFYKNMDLFGDDSIWRLCFFLDASTTLKVVSLINSEYNLFHYFTNFQEPKLIQLIVPNTDIDIIHLKALAELAFPFEVSLIHPFIKSGGLLENYMVEYCRSGLSMDLLSPLDSVENINSIFSRFFRDYFSLP